MWQPGYERFYNENLSPKITYALGKTILNQAMLAQLHPGIYIHSDNDKFTTSLLIRPRLQLQSKHWLSDTPAKVTVAGSGGTIAAVGGKGRR